MAEALIYRSEKGSEVRVSGKHWGIIEIDFDWFEEECCIESEPTFDQDSLQITAHCECCESVSVPVKLVVLDSLAS